MTMAPEEKKKTLCDGNHRTTSIRNHHHCQGGSSSSLVDSQQMRHQWSQDDEEAEREQKSIKRWSCRRRLTVCTSPSSLALLQANDNNDDATGSNEKCDHDNNDDAMKTKIDENDGLAAAWGEPSPSLLEKEKVVAAISSSSPSSPIPCSPNHHHHHSDTITTTTKTTLCFRNASPSAKNALLRLSQKVDKNDSKSRPLMLLQSPLSSSSFSAPLQHKSMATVASSLSPLSSYSSSSTTREEQDSCTVSWIEETDNSNNNTRGISKSDEIHHQLSSSSSLHALFQLNHLITGSSSSSCCSSPSREIESKQQQQKNSDAFCRYPKQIINTNSSSSNHYQVTKMSKHRIVKTTLGILIFSVLTLWRLYGPSNRSNNKNNTIDMTTTSSTTTSLSTRCVMFLAQRLEKQSAALLLIPLPWIHRFQHFMLRAMIQQAITSARKIVWNSNSNNNSSAITTLLQQQQRHFHHQVPFHRTNNNGTTVLTKSSSSWSCKEVEGNNSTSVVAYVAPPSEFQREKNPSSPSVARKGFWNERKRLFGVRNTAINQPSCSLSFFTKTSPTRGGELTKKNSPTITTTSSSSSLELLSYPQLNLKDDVTTSSSFSTTDENGAIDSPQRTCGTAAPYSSLADIIDKYMEQARRRRQRHHDT